LANLHVEAQKITNVKDAFAIKLENITPKYKRLLMQFLVDRIDVYKEKDPKTGKPIIDLHVRMRFNPSLWEQNKLVRTQKPSYSNEQATMCPENEVDGKEILGSTYLYVFRVRYVMTNVLVPYGKHMKNVRKYEVVEIGC
jgi:hypothetical protein